MTIFLPYTFTFHLTKFKMHIYNLTIERVERLQAQRAKKEVELNDFLKLSAKDLWNRDLDDLDAGWEEVLEDDTQNASKEKSMKKKGASSKLTKGSRKRMSDADGDYVERKPKVAKTKSTTSPKQSKITSFTSKPSVKIELTKAIHTAAFTSVNKAGESSTTTKTDIMSKVTPMLIDDDDDFELLVKGVRREEKPTTIELLSPSTAIKPKKTFSIPGLKKPAAPALPKARAVSKSKPTKRKADSDGEDESFSFMANDREPASAPAGERRPARAAASKARAIVLTSDDVYDEDDEEDDEDEEEDDD
jgi:DNA topoisomerase II